MVSAFIQTAQSSESVHENAEMHAKVVWLGVDEKSYEANVVVRHFEARCAKDVRAGRRARVFCGVTVCALLE